MLKFQDYRNCLMNNLIEEVNKIPLSINDDKRLQTYDRIKSYPYGSSAGKVCKTEILSKVKDKFMEYSNDMQNVYKNIEDYNPNKKRKVLIIFGDMIADMINNKKLNPTVTKLFIKSRKLNISIVFNYTILF